MIEALGTINHILSTLVYIIILFILAKIVLNKPWNGPKK